MKMFAPQGRPQAVPSRKGLEQSLIHALSGAKAKDTNAADVSHTPYRGVYIGAIWNPDCTEGLPGLI